MDLSTDSIFGLAQKKLDWLESRQSILARNVANADTPNYQPSDKVPFETLMSGLAIAPVRTNPMHLSRDANDAGTIKTTGGEQSPDGNQVSIETELAKVADTESQQRLVANLYSKYMAMFATSLGKG